MLLNAFNLVPCGFRLPVEEQGRLSGFGTAIGYVGSIVGVLPFTLVLPYVGLLWTGILTILIGLILASASSAIIVYALELVPGKIGTVAGLFFGLSFGMAGVGAAALGRLADATSIDYVYQVCAFLPLIGLLTVFLPNLGRPLAARSSAPV